MQTIYTTHHSLRSLNIIRRTFRTNNCFLHLKQAYVFEQRGKNKVQTIDTANLRV